jgi:DNA repair photolyase
MPRRPDHARGRAAQVNPPNRFEPIHLEVVDEHLEELAIEQPEGARVPTRVFRDAARTVINRVDSDDLGFRWTVNPYRGCEHGCVYCYARPTHETFGLSCGLDFETRVFAKTEAPELVRRELARPGWAGETIVLSGVTDAYQPAERSLGITRGVLEVFAGCGQPVSIVTKSRLVTRDLDLLASLAERGAARVFVSVTTLDPELARRMEPRASSPGARLETIRRLAEAGIPVGAMAAPIAPGLNDREMPAILEAARDAGATYAGWILLRLPWQVKEVFLEWVRREYPERAGRVEARIREARGGRLNDPRAHSRFRGEGGYAAQLRQLFDVTVRRLGYETEPPRLSSGAFVRPEVGGQLGLFAPAARPAG